jgi:hypothetical protein
MTTLLLRLPQRSLPLVAEQKQPEQLARQLQRRPRKLQLREQDEARKR